MEEIFRKFLYTGVGIVALTAEKLQESVDEMVGKGKVSKDEGKRLVEEFVEKMESKRDEFEERLKEAADSMTSNMRLPQFVTKEDLASLVSRIEALEAKHGIGLTAQVVAEEAVEEVKEATSKAASRGKKEAE